jgi:hypothetical protein
MPRLQLLEQLGAHGALGDGVQVVVVVEDEGQVEDLELLHAQRAELGQRGRQHLHRAQLQGLHLFLVLVELAVGIDLDLDLALGQLGRALGEELGRLALGRVGGHHVAELDDDGRLGLGGGSQQQAGEARDRRRWPGPRRVIGPVVVSVVGQAMPGRRARTARSVGGAPGGTVDFHIPARQRGKTTGYP